MTVSEEKARSNIRSLEVLMDMARSAVEDALKDSAREKRVLCSTRKSIDAFELCVRKMVSRIQEQKKENKRLAETIASMNKTRPDTLWNYEVLETKYTSAQQKCASLEKKTLELGKHGSELEATIEGLQKELQKARVVMHAKLGNLEEIGGIEAGLAKEILDYRVRVEREASERPPPPSSVQKDDAENENKEISTKEESLADTISALESELDAFKEKLRARDREIENIKTQTENSKKMSEKPPTSPFTKKGMFLIIVSSTAFAFIAGLLLRRGGFAL